MVDLSADHKFRTNRTGPTPQFTCSSKPSTDRSAKPVRGSHSRCHPVIVAIVLRPEITSFIGSIHAGDVRFLKNEVIVAKTRRHASAKVDRHKSKYKAIENPRITQSCRVTVRNMYQVRSTTKPKVRPVPFDLEGLRVNSRFPCQKQTWKT